MNELVTPRSVIRDRVRAGDADYAINTSLLRPANTSAINPDLLKQTINDPTQNDVAALQTDQISRLQPDQYILNVDHLTNRPVSPSNNLNSNSPRTYVLDVDIDALRKKAAQSPSITPPVTNPSPVEDESFLTDIGRGLKRGIQVTAPKAVGQALEFVGAEETGKNIIKSAQARATKDNEETATGRALDSALSVRGNVYEAAESSVLSLAPSIAGAGVGFALAGPAGALIGYGVGSLAALPIFYGSAAQETYDKVKNAQLKLGKSEEEAHKEASRAGHLSGTIEAGGELLADFVPVAKLFKPLTSVGTKASASLVKDMFFPSFKEGAKTVGKVMLAETATEVLQAAGQAEVEKAYGAGSGATLEDTSRVIMPTILMSLVPGLASAGIKSQQVKTTREALQNPETDPEARTKIAYGAVAALREIDETKARDFSAYAGRQISTNSPIEFKEDIFYKEELASLRGQDTTNQTDQSLAVNNIPASTLLDDKASLAAKMNLDKAFGVKQKSDTLSVMAAVVSNLNLETDAQNNYVDQTSGQTKLMIDRVAQRFGVTEELNATLLNQNAIDRGNQILSDSPTLLNDFLASASLIPAAGQVKFPRKSRPLTMEEMDEISRDYNLYDDSIDASTNIENKAGVEEFSNILDSAKLLVRDWDRNNRTGRSVEWMAGAAESNPSFVSVEQEGVNVPAHGMAKASTLTEAMNSLIVMLQGGINQDRTLFTASLTNPNSGAGAGTGTAGGVAYRDGPFIITFREGLTGQPTTNDVTGVLVNPANAELVAPIQRMFPNLVVRDFNGVADVIAGSKQSAKKDNVASSDITPSTTETNEPINPFLPSTDNPLFSRDKTAGGVKAAFFNKIRTVFYDPRTKYLTKQEFRALEMHEVGAHYATERMLGSKDYQKLLLDLRKLSETDKLAREAYDSVPLGTMPELYDDEALGYLIENYENMPIVQRFFQMIKDWYAKSFKGQEITATDIRNIVKGAYNQYQHEVKRVYLKEGISTTPRSGYVRVDFQKALDQNNEAKRFLDFISNFPNARLSGSLSIAAQQNIYRPVGNQIHDLDIQVTNINALEQIITAFRKEYPNSALANTFTSEKTNSFVLTIVLDKDSSTPLTIDFFVPANKKLDKFETESIPHNFRGAVYTRSKTILLTPATEIFDKKLEMGRAKDVSDAIQGRMMVEDILFSEKKPTLSDVPSALVKVMKQIIDTGEVKDFNGVKQIAFNRMLSNPNWKSLADIVPPVMWSEAYNKVQPEKVSDENIIESVRVESEEEADNINYQSKVKTSNKKSQKTDVLNSLSRPITIGKANPIVFGQDKLGTEQTKFMSFGTGQTQLNKIVDAITAEIKNKNVPQALKLFSENKSILRSNGILFEKLRSSVSPNKKTNQSRPLRFYKEDRFSDKFKEPTTTTKQEDKQEKEKQKVYSPAVENLRKKYDEAYANITKKSYFENLRGELIAQLNFIDEELNSFNTMNVVDDNKVKTFRGVDKTDQNPGLWGYYDLNSYARDASGFVSDKPSTKEALLYKRKMLLDELEKIRDNSMQSQANLVRLGIVKLADSFEVFYRAAITGGANKEESYELYSNYLEQLNALSGFYGKRKLDAKTRDELGERKGFEGATKADITEEIINQLNSMSESVEEAAVPAEDQVIQNLITDVKSGKISLVDTIKFITDLKKEDVNSKFVAESVLNSLIKEYEAATDTNKIKQLANVQKFVSAAQRAGLIDSNGVINLFDQNQIDTPIALTENTHLSLRQRFVDYMGEVGNSYLTRDAWLRSMNTVLTRNPALKESFTDSELAAYEAWLEAHNAIKNRRKTGDKESNKLEEAYPDVLFNSYTLEQMLSPSKLKDNDRLKLRDIGSLPDAYFQDIFTVLRNRPDLREQVEETLSEFELGEYNQWLDSKKAIAELEAKKASEAEAFRKLSGYTFISDDVFNRIKQALALADAGKYETILENTRRIGELIANAVINREVVDQDTGEILKFKNNEQLLSDHIDSLVMNSMLESVTRSGQEDLNYGSKLVEDIGFGTKEDQLYKIAQSTNTAVDDVRADENALESDDYLDDEPELRQGIYSGNLGHKLVLAYVEKIKQKWSNAPEIVVLRSYTQLPVKLRDAVAAQLTNGMGAKGMFDTATGTTYLFSDYLTSEADTQFTLFHEVYGHLGMRAFQGVEFDQFLENMYRTNAAVRTEVDAKMRDSGMGKLKAVDEVLSDMAGSGVEVSAVKSWIGKTIAGLRKNGFDNLATWLGNFTDAELSYSLSMAKQHVINGGGYSPLKGAPDDIRLAEGRLPYELFAIKDSKTKAYARYNPLSDEWYLFIANGNDIRDGNGMSIVQDYDSLMDQMRFLGKIESRTRSGYYRDNKLPVDLAPLKAALDLNKDGLRGKIDSILFSFVNKYQNQYLPVFKVIDTLEKMGRIDDFIDLRKDLKLYERKTAVRVEDFNNDEVSATMKSLREAEKAKGEFEFGATNVYEMLNKFLLAQTAEERNKQVNKINPTMVDGSGMATDTANKILNFVSTQPYAKHFNDIGNVLDYLGDLKVDNEVKAGLISKKEGEKRKIYRHYRNLSGDENVFDDPSSLVGKKFNLKGKDKRALGRSTEASDILARTLLAFEASIIRQEKNAIAQKVLALFEANYDPNFISINEQAKITKVGPDGFVQSVDNANYIIQPDVMVAKVNGYPITIRFKDTGMNSFAEAIYGKVNSNELPAIIKANGSIGKLLGKGLTTYNPYWIAVNLTKDIGQLSISASINSKIGPKAAGQMLKRILPYAGTGIRAALEEMRITTKAGEEARKNLLLLMESRIGSVTAGTLAGAAAGSILPGVGTLTGAIAGALPSYFASNTKDDQERMAVYQEARKSGALTSFIDRKNLEQQIINIDEALKGKSAISKIEGLFKFMELMTVPMELAPRLAAYEVLTKEKGWSKRDASVTAGEITVDFNMRGSNEWVRNLYQFFNPAIQGTAGMLKLMKNNPQRFAVAATGLATLGLFIGAITRSVGDDDEEKKKRGGRNVIDDIPTYKRATTMILLPGTPYGAIPLPYGFNAFYSSGLFLSDSIFGNTPAKTTAARILNTYIDAFSPVGAFSFDATKVFSEPVKQLFNLLMPTTLSPLYQLETNQNRFGSPIIPSTIPKNRAGFSEVTNTFHSVNPYSKSFAESLQRATGGDVYNKKGIDLNPAMMDYMLESYAPGMVASLYRGAGIAKRREMGENVGREKEPLIDRFSAYPAESANDAMYRKVAPEVTGIYQEIINTQDMARKQALIEKYPNIGGVMQAISAIDNYKSPNRSMMYKLEDIAVKLRQAGKIEDAEKQQAAAIAFRNLEQKNERELYGRLSEALIKSGFKDLVFSD